MAKTATTRPIRLTGQVISVSTRDNGYCEIACPDAPNQVIFLLKWQVGKAVAGDNVVVEYRSSATHGEFVVTKVLA